MFAFATHTQGMSGLPKRVTLVTGQHVFVSLHYSGAARSPKTLRARMPIELRHVQEALATQHTKVRAAAVRTRSREGSTTGRSGHLRS